MSLELDERRIGMLAEMGIRLFKPDSHSGSHSGRPVYTPPEPPRQAVGKPAGFSGTLGYRFGGRDYDRCREAREIAAFGLASPVAFAAVIGPLVEARVKQGQVVEDRAGHQCRMTGYQTDRCAQRFQWYLGNRHATDADADLRHITETCHVGQKARS